MSTFMEKQQATDYDERLEELLRDKEKLIAIIKNSPYLQKKHDEAVEALSQLKPPFPWDAPKAK